MGDGQVDKASKQSVGTMLGHMLFPIQGEASHFNRLETDSHFVIFNLKSILST